MFLNVVDHAVKTVQAFCGLRVEVNVALEVELLLHILHVLHHHSPTLGLTDKMPNIGAFASRHDLILFVCGRKSSNGKVLFNECRRVNPNSRLIEQPSEIDLSWVKGLKTVGICGATSTPKWLMEQCRDYILDNLK